MWAAERGSKPVVELLLAHKDIEFDSQDRGYGWTPLAWAARDGHEAMTELLIDHGVAVNTTDTTRCSSWKK